MKLTSNDAKSFAVKPLRFASLKSISATSSESTLSDTVSSDTRVTVTLEPSEVLTSAESKAFARFSESVTSSAEAVKARVPDRITSTRERMMRLKGNPP